MTGAQASLWALVVAPAVVGAALLLGPRGRTERPAPVLGVGTAALAAVLAVVVALARPSVAVPFVAGADLGLGVDGLAAVVAPTVAVVAALVLLAGAVDVRESRARFHGLMLVFVSAALLTVTATTLPALLLAWEVMGATSYALIGFAWRDDRRVGSGLTAFVTTRAADLGLYVAAAAALAGGAGLDLDALASASPGWRDVLAAGVLVAALGKAAQLVLAFWLSRAMDGPSPVSALLHSAAMVAMGGYLLLRLSPLLQATSWAGPTAAWAGALTTVALGVVAVGQRDLKQLLAASTSAQLGYVVMAGGLGAVPGGTAHLVAHAATKAALFLAAGAWLAALGTKQLAGLRGAVAHWPVLRVAATVALLALAGVPPLSLWATKDLVLAAALEQSPALYVVGILGAAAAAAYAGTVLRVLWAPAGDADQRRARAHRGEEETPRAAVPGALTAAVVVLAVGATALGALAIPAVAESLARTVGGRPRTRACSSSGGPRPSSSSSSPRCGSGRSRSPPGHAPGWAWRPRPTPSSSGPRSRWPGPSTGSTAGSPAVSAASPAASWPWRAALPRPTTRSSGAPSPGPPAAPGRSAVAPRVPTTAGSTVPCSRSPAGCGGRVRSPAVRRPDSSTSTTSRPSRSSPSVSSSSSS